jgi:hypothetical protein
LELRLRWRRKFAARRTLKGEAQVVSGKDPTRLQRHRFDATVEVVKSVPEGVDEVQHYSFRLTAPEYSELFDGTEQLISIRVSPWYMRHVFMP